ncbi:hypothetical protein ACWCRF_23875 [Streptomyces sp. NPDC002405]|uniref:hypothetical protein n=1 Tax=Streptomyces sp. NPDC001231 TaxID=3364549 RepID=UPI0036B3B20F
MKRTPHFLGLGPSWRRSPVRPLVCAAVAATLAGYLLALPVTAQAAVPVPALDTPSQQAEIAVTPGGFTAPDVLRAGAVTFRVRSDDPQGAWIGLVRLRPGVSLERYLHDLERAMGDDPVASLAGGEAIAQDVEMLGGAAVARVPAQVTLRVTPGTYHLVDFRDVGLPDLAARVRTVRVLPGPVPAGTRPPGLRSTARVILRDGVFEAPAVLDGTEAVRVENRSRQHNEAMLVPVRAGVTLADLDAFFADVDAGRRPDGSPFTGGPTGVVPLSPGRSALLATELPAEHYALVTWVRDLETGRMFAAHGMRALVTVVRG